MAGDSNPHEHPSRVGSVTMIVTFRFPGEWYHNHKKEFKKARDAYPIPLEFKGFQDMGWKSQFEDIKILSQRDIDPKTGREFSVETTVVWEGEMTTELLAWMKKEWAEFELNPIKEQLKKFDEETQRQIKSWKESLNRPPEGFINAYLKERSAKRKLIETQGEVARETVVEPVIVGRPYEEIFGGGNDFGEDN